MPDRSILISDRDAFLLQVSFEKPFRMALSFPDGWNTASQTKGSLFLCQPIKEPQLEQFLVFFREPAPGAAKSSCELLILVRVSHLLQPLLQAVIYLHYAELACFPRGVAPPQPGSQNPAREHPHPGNERVHRVITFPLQPDFDDPNFLIQVYGVRLIVDAALQVVQRNPEVTAAQFQPGTGRLHLRSIPHRFGQFLVTQLQFVFLHRNLSPTKSRKRRPSPVNSPSLDKSQNFYVSSLHFLRLLLNRV